MTILLCMSLSINKVIQSLFIYSDCATYLAQDKLKEVKNRREIQMGQKQFCKEQDCHRLTLKGSSEPLAHTPQWDGQENQQDKRKKNNL